VRNLIYLTFITIFTLTACQNGDQPNRPDFGGRNGGQNNKTSVETIQAKQQTISKQVRSYGNIRAHDIVNIMPQVNNRITQMHVDLGDTVQQRQVLAEIYAKPYQDQVEQNRAQLSQSRSALTRDSLQFVRQKQLYEKELISDTEFQNAKSTYMGSKAQFESAQAALQQSLENLNNTKVRSPVFGVILAKNLEVGDMASSGQAIFEIANLTGLETHVYLPVQEWEEVRIGQEVNLRASNADGFTAQGRVSRKSPRIDPQTGLGEVVVTLTQIGPFIHQGVLAETVINVETKPNAVVIPRAALVENVQTFIQPESNTIELSKEYSVFVVQHDSVAKRRKVELGINQGDQVEIANGLKAGDEIVITGQNSLQDSSLVQVAGSTPFQQGEQQTIQTSNQQADPASNK